MMTPQEQKINHLLIHVYTDILRVEEHYLRHSQFHDLSVKEVHTIDAITMYTHKTASEVAQELKVVPGTLTASINNLVRKGYVTRIKMPEDRRFTRLGLTRRGRLVYRAHQSFHRQMAQSFLADMSEEQVILIERALLNLQGFLEMSDTKETATKHDTHSQNS